MKFYLKEIYTLNADDYFESNNALKKISSEFNLDDKISLLMTNIKIINKKIRY